MSDVIQYKIFEVPLFGRNLAGSRTPRLQPSVPAEFGDILSRDVSAGEFSVDPQTGEYISSKGQSIAEYLEFCISTRPHWLMPVEKGGEDEADETWTSGNLTKQGARLKHLEKFCGSKQAALVMLTEEAALYGVKPFTKEIGVKPGEKGNDKSPAANLSTNPWSASFRGDEDQRSAQIASIIKKGTKFAASLAKAAGTTIGRPLRK